MSPKAPIQVEFPNSFSRLRAPRSRYFTPFFVVALAATLATTTTFAGSAPTTAARSTTKLLTANFESRRVAQVEVGDFHFKPGQIAPIHTHTAPAIGYVAKGMIIYQVEGERPQILRAGEAFYEPVGPRILRFDNASATEEAIFVDFNLEQVDEPFIVFEEKPTEAIDRRTLPTVSLEGKSVERADVFDSELEHSGETALDGAVPTLGLVTKGVIELRIQGRPAERIVAGRTFALPTGNSRATIVNTSSEVSAKVVTFRLH